MIHLLDINDAELGCATGSGYQTAEINYTTLIKGGTYFIVVDNNPSGQAGAFTLCVNGGAAASQFCSSIYCDTEGNVGIGTPVVASGYKLSVVGKIMAEGVKVELQSRWPDYVFEDKHKLRPLSEVEKFIKENGHLPEIPSATEVGREGIDLGAMDAKLLQKVEELTLYMIQMNERGQQLEARVQQLENENKKLKEQLNK